MRRIRYVAIVLAMALAACGSDSPDSTASSPPPASSTTTTATTADTAAPGATTAATDTGGTNTVGSTAEVTTTDASTTTTGLSATTTTSLPGPLVPQAVCLGGNEAYYFGYDNQSAAPAVVPEGPKNALAGAAADDNPLLTTLFAPGRVDAAFWAFYNFSDGQPSPVTWTLTGPDGITRSATADATLPVCPEGYPDNVVDDPRMPQLVVTQQTLSPSGDSIEVHVELQGVPDTSVCNAAFHAEPVLISLLDTTRLPTSIVRTATVVVDLVDVPLSANVTGKFGGSPLTPLVVDQCSAAGVTVRSWSPAEAMSRLAYGESVCVTVDAAGQVDVEVREGCLPFTGGSSIRPK